ncbi:hypothetical protein D3C73_1215320 [compost metagenome]
MPGMRSSNGHKLFKRKLKTPHFPSRIMIPAARMIIPVISLLLSDISSRTFQNDNGGQAAANCDISL